MRGLLVRWAEKGEEREEAEEQQEGAAQPRSLEPFFLFLSDIPINRLPSLAPMPSTPF